MIIKMESRDLLYSLINRIYGLGGWGSCPFKETVLGVLLLSESPEDFHQPLGQEGVVSILGQLLCSLVRASVGCSLVEQELR